MADEPEPDARHEIDSRLGSIGVTAVHLSRSEIVGFHDRYSNRLLWSVLHEMGSRAWHCDDWKTYRAVNERFAQAIACDLRVGDLVWVHDYPLMLVPRLVRKWCPWARISFLLHTPFPPVDTFMQLPHATALIDGVLGADAIEMRAPGHVCNFLCAANATRLFRSRSAVVDDRGRRVPVFAGRNT
jgi:trehalose-6-phosphate synthase